MGEKSSVSRARLIAAVLFGLGLASAFVALDPQIRGIEPVTRDDSGVAQLDTASAVTTPSGLRYQDFIAGTGAAPRDGQTVIVHYRGRLTNGFEFDTSRQTGRGPFQFRVGAGQVIKGWDEGVGSMKVGGVRRLVIPPQLAYGAAPAPGGKIPPGSTLVFDIELLGVE